jgi:hypothetical protein
MHNILIQLYWLHSFPPVGAPVLVEAMCVVVVVMAFVNNVRL